MRRSDAREPAPRAARARPGAYRRGALALVAIAACTAGAATATPATAPTAAPAPGPLQAPGTAPDCAAAPALPARVELVFDLQASRWGFALHGENRLVFTRADGRYELAGSTRAAALYRADYQSRGTVVGDRLRPDEYVERRGRRERRTTIDWAAGRTRFASPEAPPGDTPEGLQDRLSLLLQLGWTLRHQPQAERLEFPLAGLGRNAVYRFAARGREPVALPHGAEPALRFDRVAEGEEGLEVWIAPRLCWLPARVRLIDAEGNAVDQRLRAWTVVP